ncbi:restriction endonuclease subunit S [Kaistella sp. G5-32]|uniref:Restriction endonuclease subunit S n=1 Tax=Kaistella gelatinilytica TaxID=2787636 RepID=A0ABS0FF95_9FLAO|nr:restriction endonuclease subunit S [Kaistella gelatinilytica]MBF8458318.1 restriction endonuclease subunit S [Kaistella gelatinilytica]
MVKETRMKQTEIGLIPEDWNIEKIKDISLIKTGSKNTQDRIENGIYPFFVRSQTIERINSYSFDGEAILTAGDGVGVGKVFHYLNEKFDFHQRVYAIYNFRNDVSGFYFFKYFQNNFLGRIMQMTAKSSVDSVRMETISEMPIPLPPLAEQEAIATALSDCDSWIDSIEEVLAKKRLIKQGAMQKLLTPKEDWEVKKLGEVLQFGSGRDYKHLHAGEVPVYGTGGIMTYVTAHLYDGESVGIGRKGTIDKPVFLQGKFWTVDTLFFTHSFNGVIPKYIFYQFLLIAWKEYNEASGVPSLNKNTLEQIEIQLPSLSDQTRIAAILSDMDLEIEALEEKLHKARQIKQGMMQELLTGRVRLV